jgi:hypothetical protein
MYKAMQATRVQAMHLTCADRPVRRGSTGP